MYTRNARLMGPLVGVMVMIVQSPGGTLHSVEDISDDVQAITDAVGVMQSATTLINGFAGRLEAAIAKALEGGASAEQLAPLIALKTSVVAETANLAAAVAANSEAPASAGTEAAGSSEAGSSEADSSAESGGANVGSGAGQ